MAGPSDNPLKRLIRETHRRSLWQVLGIYLVASWAVLQVVDTIGGALNLPDWFPSFAFALLIIGLPIVLATAFVQEGVSGGGETHTDSAASAAAPGSSLFTWSNALTGGVLAFALLGFVGTGWVVFGGSLGTGEAPESVEQSVAVLPFVNMSGNPANEYFSDGITEELLNALSQLPGLRVPARTSSFAFKGQNIPIGQIADALGVAHVLEGSVRREGNRVLITAQLVDARTDSHLWSETFERELDDIFAIQREIATAITDQLRVSLSVDQQARLVGEATESTDAYEAYLRGRYLWSQRSDESLRNAIAQFERAIELDSGYAEAFSGLADSYVLVDVYDPNPEALDYRANYQRALVAAQRAVSLAPELATARASLGMVLGMIGSWERGEEELDSAIRLNPGLATAHQRYGMHLATMGRGNEGVPYAERALELDPLSRGISYNLGNVYRLAGMREQAIEQLRATTELDPDWLTGWFNLATELLEAGRYEEGLEAWDVTLRLGNYDVRLGTEAYEAAIRYQETGEAASFADFDTGLFQLLWLYARSGQPARAIDWFEVLIRQGAYLIAAQLHVMFVDDAVGDDPRYRALLAEAGITW